MDEACSPGAEKTRGAASDYGISLHRHIRESSDLRCSRLRFLHFRSSSWSGNDSVYRRRILEKSQMSWKLSARSAGMPRRYRRVIVRAMPRATAVALRITVCSVERERLSVDERLDRVEYYVFHVLYDPITTSPRLTLREDAEASKTTANADRCEFGSGRSSTE